MALLEGLTVGSVLGSLIAGWTDKGVGKAAKALHQRLREGKLPINHDLQKAVERSLCSSLLVLHNELSAASTKGSDRFWLDHFENAIKTEDKLATFGTDLFVEERQIHEFLSKGRISDLPPNFTLQFLSARLKDRSPKPGSTLVVPGAAMPFGYGLASGANSSKASNNGPKFDS